MLKSVIDVDEDTDVSETQTGDSSKPSVEALTPEKELIIIREKKTGYKLFKLNDYTVDQKCTIQEEQFCVKLEAITNEKHVRSDGVTREEESVDSRNETNCENIKEIENNTADNNVSVKRSKNIDVKRVSQAYQCKIKLYKQLYTIMRDMNIRAVANTKVNGSASNNQDTVYTEIDPSKKITSSVLDIEPTSEGAVKNVATNEYVTGSSSQLDIHSAHKVNDVSSVKADDSRQNNEISVKQGNTNTSSEADIILLEETIRATACKSVGPLPLPQWAHFDKDNNNLVYFTSAEDPSEFFVRLIDFTDCLYTLNKKIQKYISEEDVKPMLNVTVGDLVLALFPDDLLYYRARVDAVIDNGNVKCFFVDYGDWKVVSRLDITQITNPFITLLPFQAIECRLVGIQPSGEMWTGLSTDKLYNLCFVGQSDYLKQLYLQYFVKETSKHTSGHKYAVVLIDTTTPVDIVLNQVLLDGQLARAIISEIHYLNDVIKMCVTNQKSNSSESEEDKLQVEAILNLDENYQHVLNQTSNSFVDICVTPNVTTPDSYIRVETNESPAMVEKENTFTLNVTTPDSFLKVETKENLAMVEKKDIIIPNVTTPDSYIRVETNESPAMVEKVNFVTSEVPTHDSFMKVEMKESPAMGEKQNITQNVTTSDILMKVETKESPAMCEKQNITQNVTTCDSLMKVETRESPAMGEKQNITQNVTTSDSLMKVETKESPAMGENQDIITQNVTTSDSLMKVETKESPAMGENQDIITQNVTTSDSLMKVETKESPAMVEKENIVTSKVTTHDSLMKVETKESPAMGENQDIITQNVTTSDSLMKVETKESPAMVEKENIVTSKVTTHDSLMKVETKESPAMGENQDIITQNVTTSDSLLKVETKESPAMGENQDIITQNVTTSDSLMKVETKESPAMGENQDIITQNVTTSDSLMKVETKESPAMGENQDIITQNVTTSDSLMILETKESPAMVEKENIVTSKVTTHDSFMKVETKESTAMFEKDDINVTTPDRFIKVGMNESPAMGEKQDTFTLIVTTSNSFMKVETKSPPMVGRQNIIPPSVTTPDSFIKVETKKITAIVKKDNILTPNVTTTDSFMKVKTNESPAMIEKENTITLKSNDANGNSPSLKMIELDSDVNESSSGREIPSCSAMTSLAKRNLHRKPKLVWYQSTSTVFIKVKVYGISQYKFDLSGERKLKFYTKVRNINYSFDLELYREIDSSKSSHAKKGVYVTMRLAKKMQFKWVNLFAGDEKRNWVVYNLDMINTSSEDDVEDIEKIRESVMNMFKDDGNNSMRPLRMTRITRTPFAPVYQTSDQTLKY